MRWCGSKKGPARVGLERGKLLAIAIWWLWWRLPKREAARLGTISGSGAIWTEEALMEARVMLGWSRSDLAKRAGVHRKTICRLDHGSRVGVFTQDKLVRAMEEAGVEFTAMGVRRTSK
jgi:hypothetical protein